MMVTLNGRSLDLARALPLTLGDWRALQRRGITAKGLAAGADAESLAGLLYHVLHKADPEVTEAHVDALPMRDPVVKAVLEALAEAEAPDRPFSSTSTPSG